MAHHKNQSIESFDTLNHLITQIYDAAVDALRWPEFLESLSDLCDGQTVGLLLYDRKNRQSFCDIPLSFVHHVRADPDWIADFERYYCTINPWMEYFAASPEGTVTCSSHMIADDVFFRTEFYNDWLKLQDYRYSLGAQVRQGEALVVSLSLLHADKATSAELALIRHLVPHLQRACSLHIRLEGNSVLANASFSVLDRLPTGVILLDRRGAVRVINKSADRILHRNDGLLIDKTGLCEAVSLSETSQLRQLIAEAVQTGTGSGQGAGGGMKLTRMAARPLSILVSPLRASNGNLTEEVCAVLFISDPDSEQAVSGADLLQQIYGLTTAQARLAQALSQGLSVEDYAEQHQLSCNTVRTHLKHLFDKTDTHRQGDLVRVLVSGPAFIRRE